MNLPSYSFMEQVCLVCTGGPEPFPSARIRGWIQEIAAHGQVKGVVLNGAKAFYRSSLLAELSDFVREFGLAVVVDPGLGRPAWVPGEGHGRPTSSLPCNGPCTLGNTPVILPDGRVFACLGPVQALGHVHPLLLGDLNEEPLAVVLDRAQGNSVLHALRVWGPWKLISMVEELGGGRYLPDTYDRDSTCDACFHIMASPPLLEMLLPLTRGDGFREALAQSRAYFLGESMPKDA
ncbi:MAG: hypothetical protein MI749_03890 [Desulfovibrionales bacterium]|nr:hypothetical protein [Desulfovibrionales bacterium]